MWSRLSPSEQRFYELPEPPGEGDYYWDEEGMIRVWYPAHADEAKIHQARARLHHPVVVGDQQR
jgi:hypothetical protein